MALKRDLVPHGDVLLFPLEVANGVLALLIGLQFVAVTAYVRLRYRRGGVGPEQRKALAVTRGLNSLLLLPDNPAAVPEEMHTRWDTLQTNSLEAVVAYLISRTVFGLVGLAPFFNGASIVDTLVFVDSVALVFLASRMLDTYCALKGFQKSSSLTVDFSNVVNTLLCIAAAVGYLGEIRLQTTLDFYFAGVALTLIALTVFGALSRYKLRQRGGEDYLDSLMEENTSMSQRTFIRGQRFREVHRNLLEGLFLFFLPATFAVVEPSLATVYSVVVSLYLGGRALWLIFFLWGKQPYRTALLSILQLAMFTLYIWYIVLLCLDHNETIIYKLTHVCFFLLVCLYSFVEILTGFFRYKYGVRSFPEDVVLIKRVTVEEGVGEVGALRDAQRTLVESIIVLVFILFADELPFYELKYVLRKTWLSVVPVITFVVVTYAQIAISLAPSTRKYGAYLFLLSYLVLLAGWSVEEYLYYTYETAT
eukprot:TRINITY_DN4450_c0_g1_i1.p1 TRINITY_DN4450_c0_g1~~TRINITY_DN4450_c0_g1_i1.p1  ORF type:complete len:478 (+),score=48.63 TRINITY_DN4450_c0_g1_i1:71-1504(+)